MWWLMRKIRMLIEDVVARKEDQEAPLDMWWRLRRMISRLMEDVVAHEEDQEAH